MRRLIQTTLAACLCLIASSGRAQDSDLDRTLLTAAAGRDVNAARELIRKGANVNAQHSGSRRPALMNAVLYSSIEMVRLLVENGADPYLQDSEGYTPMSVANGQYRMWERDAEVAPKYRAMIEIMQNARPTYSKHGRPTSGGGAPPYVLRPPSPEDEPAVVEQKRARKNSRRSTAQARRRKRGGKITVTGAQ